MQRRKEYIVSSVINNLPKKHEETDKRSGAIFKIGPGYSIRSINNRLVFFSDKSLSFVEYCRTKRAFEIQRISIFKIRTSN